MILDSRHRSSSHPLVAPVTKESPAASSSLQVSGNIIIGEVDAEFLLKSSSFTYHVFACCLLVGATNVLLAETEEDEEVQAPLIRKP